MKSASVLTCATLLPSLGQVQGVGGIGGMPPDEKASVLMERLGRVSKLLGEGGGMDTLLATGPDTKWRTRMLQLIRKAGVHFPESSSEKGKCLKQKSRGC